MASLATTLHRRPRLRLSLLLVGPVGWLGVAYIGSLVALLVAAFWSYEPFTAEVLHTYDLHNFQALLEGDVYRTIALRTIGVAAAVTVTDALLAFPIAFYMAKIASPRARGLLVIAVLMPLWSSYLVKVYAWRQILSEDGILNWALHPLGLSGPGYGLVATWLVFTYLWLPFMVLPIFAGLQRIPNTLLDASGDLGAGAGLTFRRVVLPLVFPAVVAGSIFTFSLTLGDYITPQYVSSTQFIANVVQSNVSANLPLGAAYAMLPVVVMLVYLLVARRLGAFRNL